MATKRVKRKKIKKVVPSAVAHVHSSYNNTIITIADPKGEAIVWSSAGALGFKGSKKSTPYAAKLVAQAIAASALEYGVKELKVMLKGTGPGKDASLRQLQASEGFKITEVKDVTPRPFNGCRKPKKRWNS
ncbi:MAG: 30S ribosomal protein S11 [Mycoplasmataceae bacterium]|nr:30S ribosomal protein S11 [Mycoplasmataceae bacterium]